MIRGDRNKIDLSISSFKDFIQSNNLYVDKTRFIENIINESNIVVLLFTRPRRSGKSLNISMLKFFLDCKENSIKLFEGLYIEKSDCMNDINKYPVIFLDFKNLRGSEYISQIKNMIEDIAYYYLKENQINRKLKRLFDSVKFDTNAILYLS